MADHSYGVVVEKYNSNFGIWLLFRGTNSYLSSLNPNACEGPLRVGDIVRATTTTRDTLIRRIWPLRESVWTEADKVVARSIVSFDHEITIGRGRWTDDDAAYILLVSRDLGLVVAPVNWYNRELYESGDSHLLAYVEYRHRQLTNMTTCEREDVYWSIMENRISLPAAPSNVEDPADFLAPDRIRKVPVLIMATQGKSMLGWSYALGDHMVISSLDEDYDIGKWCMATVIRSSPRDFESHGCRFTAVHTKPADPFSQPEVKVDRGRISMVLQLTRTETGDEPPEAQYKLWHDYWGLPVGYSYLHAAWIGGESSVFKAVVEVLITGDDDKQGRRATIMAIKPAVMPRLVDCISPPLPPDPPVVKHAFEDVNDLKHALIDANQRQSVQSEWAEPPQSNWADSPQSKWMEPPQSNQSITKEDSPQSKFADSPQSIWEESPQSMWTESPQPNDSRSSDRQGAASRQSTDNGWMNNNNNNNVAEDWFKPRPGQTTMLADNKPDAFEEMPALEKQDDNRVSSRPRPPMWQDVPKFGLKDNRVIPKRRNTLGLDKEVRKQDELKAKQDEMKAKQVDLKAKDSGNLKDEGGSGKGKSDGWGATKGKVWADKEDHVEAAPIRDFDDKEIERKWKVAIASQGWKFPKEHVPIVIPEGDDGWLLCGSKNFGKFDPPPPPTMPVQELVNKRNFLRDVTKIKTKRCLITKIKWNANWTEAEHIELYILDWPCALVYHRCGRNSYLKAKQEFTTVGNCVDVHIIKRGESFFVYDEMWRHYKRRLEVPMREVTNQAARVRVLQLILNTKCLSPDVQQWHNENHQLGQPFIVLTDDLFNKVVYFGKSIDAREYDDYTFQVSVETSPFPELDSFWKAKEVIWRIKKEVLDGFGPGPPPPPSPPRPVVPTPPQRMTEFHATRDILKQVVDPRRNSDVIPREERLQKLLDLYNRLLENPDLMDELFERTGFDYKRKIISFKESIETSFPNSGSMRKELQSGADFLRSLYENDYVGEIFREKGEKLLWKVLVKLGDNLKAFRTPVHTRTWKGDAK